MNRTQTLAVAVLATLLPFAQTAFASDREHGDRGHGRSEHARGYDYGHDQHRYRGHHDSHHYSHRHTRYCQHGHDDHDDYSHDAGHYSYNNQRAQIVLPFPPLPPFPGVVLSKKHHIPYIELRHSR